MLENLKEKLRKQNKLQKWAIPVMREKCNLVKILVFMLLCKTYTQNNTNMGMKNHMQNFLTLL